MAAVALHVLLVTLISLFATGKGQVQRGVSEGPLNDAAVVGSTVILHCEADGVPPTVRIQWFEFATTPFGSLISDNVNITNHPNRDRYTIIHVRESQFDLEIRNVELGDGGRYLCGDTNEIPGNRYYGSAQLVILASDPQCNTIIPPDGSLVDRQFYSIDCILNYRGNIAPRMYWSGPEPYLRIIVSDGEGLVWTAAHFNASKEHQPLPFQCKTNFSEVDSGGIDEIASNAPSYEHTFSTAPVNVYWPPEDALVIPVRPSYVVGDLISCIASGNPDPTYQWTNMLTLQPLPPGPTFTVTSSMVGLNQTMRCQITNSYLNTNNTIDIFQPVYVPEPTTVPTMTPPGPTTPPPADAPCETMTGRWVSTNPAAQMCMQVDEKGNLFHIIRNGTDQYFVGGMGKTIIGNYDHCGFTAHWPDAGVAGFVGECHRCYGTEILLVSGLARNKHAGDVCGASVGTQLTQLYVFSRTAPMCLGLEVDEVRTSQPWILDKLGVRAKKIITF